MIARLRRLTGGLLACAMLLASGLNSAHAGVEASAVIERVHAFLYDRVASRGEEVVIEVRAPSVQLPPCEAPRPFLPSASQPPLGRISVGVRCGAGGNQVRYLQAHVGVIGDYLVAARDIAPGTEVTAAMVETRRGDLSRLPRLTVHDAAAVVGQIARRSLAAGRPLQASQLRVRPLVERGQQVVIEARGSAFRVTREGEALDDGGKGEQVRVRVARRELITATVVGDARLAVDF